MRCTALCTFVRCPAEVSADEPRIPMSRARRLIYKLFCRSLLFSFVRKVDDPISGWHPFSEDASAALQIA